MIALALLLAAAVAAPSADQSKRGEESPLPPLAADAFLGRVAARNRGVRSVAGEFVQKKRMAAFKQELESRGRFRFEPPARLSWEYVSPDPSSLVVDGNRVTMRLPDEPSQTHDLSRQPTLRALVRPLQALLGAADATKALRDYEATLHGEPSAPMLRLRPRDEALRARIGGLEIAFEPRTLLPRVVTATEPSGDVTHIEFQRVVRTPER